MRKGKRGQMNLSFGMIFSVILIVIFIVFAIYVIKMLLDGMERDKILLFIDDLREDIDNSWKSSQSSQEVTYNLPKKIEYVCFVDYVSKEKGQNSILYDKLRQVYTGEENLFFYPVGSGDGLDSFKINHINLEKITERENPFCIKNTDGEVNIILKKDFGEALVYIER